MRPTFQRSTTPGEFSDSELHSTRIDQFKAQIDLLKHVATLDTASLLVVVSMLDKLLQHAHAKALIGASVVLLLLSLGAAGLAFISTLGAFPRKGARRQGSKDRRDHLVVLIVCYLGFVFGVGSAAAFFLLNWFA